MAFQLLEKLKSESSGGLIFSHQFHHPDSTEAHIVDWIFVLDSLNFCFWNDGENLKWKVNGQSGYFALCAALKRAIAVNVTIYF